MQKKTITIQTLAGAVVPNASVSVYVAGTNFTTLASGVQDGDGAAQNPVIADIKGQATIAAPDGVYDLRGARGDGTFFELFGVEFYDQQTAISDAVDVTSTNAEQTSSDRQQTMASASAASAANEQAQSAALIAQNSKEAVAAIPLFETNRPPVRLATNGPLPANTYLAGVFTMTTTGVLTVDGMAVALNDDIVVKDEADRTHNRIVRCTTAGAVGIAAVLTPRATEDTGAELANACVQVQDGTANEGWTYRCQQSEITLDTTAITFAGQPGSVASEAAIRASAVALKADMAYVDRIEFLIYAWISANVETSYDQNGDLIVLQQSMVGKTAISYYVAAAVAGQDVITDIGGLAYPSMAECVIDTDGQLRVLSVIDSSRSIPVLQGGAPSMPGPTTFCVFLINGQSNRAGRATGGPMVPTNIGYVWKDGSLQSIVDPIGIYSSDAGSSWPAFAQRFYELTGMGVVLVPQAKGSTTLVDAAAVGQDSWGAAGTLRAASVTTFNACLAALDLAHISYLVGGVFWGEGETCASKIDSAVITVSDYDAAWRDTTLVGGEPNGLMPYLTKNLAGGSQNLPFLLSQTGMPGGGDTSGFAQIRAAQMQWVRDFANVHMSFAGAKTFPSRNLMLDSTSSQLHYSQAGYNQMGATEAVTAAALARII